jgi:riboflavin synthase
MFTGLVRAVARLERSPAGVRVHLDHAGGSPRAEGLTAADLALGDSIAVDGVCLTVAERCADGFRADVSEETLRRSTLARKADLGEWVNLEPALRLSDRLGGHLVSGHVDGLGVVRAITREAAAWRLELAWDDPSYGRFLCDKASIAVDGISLTVAGCEADGAVFWIAVIPHTWAGTTLTRRRVGDAVNLEADLLAKYTERLLESRLGGHGSGGAAAGGTSGSGITAAWLAENGWSAG